MATAPYDPLSAILNAARTRLNDRVETLVAISGKILDNTQPFSQQMVNDAWRKMQGFLANLRFSGLDQETVILNLPAAASTDPLNFIYLSWSGYYDGTTLQASPFLPQNFIRPQRIWERPHALGGTKLTELAEVVEGLPAVPKLPWNRLWEWRGDSLYLPGTTVATDLRIRFESYFPDFVDNSPTPGTAWYGQPVPIMRCLDAFADYICREVSIARGDVEGAMAFQSSAEGNARLIPARDTLELSAPAKASEFGKMSNPQGGQQ